MESGRSRVIDFKGDTFKLWAFTEPQSCVGWVNVRVCLKVQILPDEILEVGDAEILS